MFCSKCGRQIPDGTVCPCTYGQPALSETPFVHVLRSIGSSPRFLTAAILYTLSALLPIVSALLPGSLVYTRVLRDILPADLADLIIQMVYRSAGAGSIGSALAALIPNGVIIAAVWIHFFACKDRRSGTVSLTGLNILRVCFTIGLALLYVAAILFFIVLLFRLVFEGAASSSVLSGFGGFLSKLIAMVFTTGSCVFAIAFVTAKRNLIDRAKLMLTSDETDFTVSRFLIAVNWISAVFTAFSGLMELLVIPLSGVSTLCSAAYTILITLCITRYRREMSVLAEQHVRAVLGRRSAQAAPDAGLSVMPYDKNSVRQTQHPQPAPSSVSAEEKDTPPAAFDEDPFSGLDLIPEPPSVPRDSDPPQK